MAWPGIPVAPVLRDLPFRVGKIALTDFARRCVLCDAWAIAKGTPCIYVSYEHQDSYYTHTVCLPCWGLFPAVSWWFTEQRRINNIDYHVWASAHIHDEYWGWHAKRYLARAEGREPFTGTET